MIRIPVDFNAMNKEGTRIWINTKINPQFVKVLQPGLRVMLYEEGDTQVEAVIEIEEDEMGVVMWYGMPDWSTQTDIP